MRALRRMLGQLHHVGWRRQLLTDIEVTSEITDTKNNRNQLLKIIENQ